jgi:hypothetical protein
MLDIEFQSEGFPPRGPVQNTTADLRVGWDDLLWAAITVGRPNWHYVLRHGSASLYEALFRISAVRMTLEQGSPRARRFRRTAAARNLDPSEKGAVNYFLGLTLCKLFAEKTLSAPWMLHLDVFRQQLNPRLLGGRSRPDLIGRTPAGEWLALESKGRVSSPSADAKRKAKDQAKRVVSVNGRPVTYRIGGFSYFKDETLKFYWKDPQPDGVEPANPIRLELSEDDLWKAYYLPIAGLFRSAQSLGFEQRDATILMKEADLELKLQPEVLRLLRVEKWKDAGQWCLEHTNQLAENKVRGDGLQIVAGDTWHSPFKESME